MLKGTRDLYHSKQDELQPNRPTHASPMPLISAYSRECVSTEAYPPLHHLQGLQIDWEAPWHSVRGPFRAAGSEMLTALGSYASMLRPKFELKVT